jgi:hypothetical protein
MVIDIIAMTSDLVIGGIMTILIISNRAQKAFSKDAKVSWFQRQRFCWWQSFIHIQMINFAY